MTNATNAKPQSAGQAMPMQARFKHAKILNALVEMQESPAYAVRKSVLQECEIALSASDVEIDALRERVTELQRVLVQAVESTGHRISGPTDSRAAEHGEPAWVCNARAALRRQS